MAGNTRTEKSFRAALLSATAACILIPAAALAQEDETSPAGPETTETYVFSPIVSIATRTEREEFTTPATLSIITADEIALDQPYSYEDVFEGVPGVSVLGGPRRMAEEPDIRGFTDEQVVIRIDGARQNFNQAHRGRFFVDPTLLKEVEVLSGPGAALYGSGALGGVIALDTKDPVDIIKPGNVWGGQLSGGYQSQGGEWYGSATGAVKAEGFDAMVSYVYRDATRDFTDGAGNDIIATQSTLNDVLAKIGYDFNEDHRLEASFQFFEDEGQNPAAANTESTGTDVVDRDTIYRSYKLAYEGDFASPYLDVNALLYRNEASVNEDMVFSPRLDTTEYNTTGFELTNTSDLGSFGILEPKITTGFEWYRDDQSGTRNGITRPEFPDANASYYAGFLVAELKIAEQIDLIPGIRYDYFALEADGAFPDQNEGHFSPSVLLGYEPVEEVYVWGGWANAFRAPSLTELYTTGTHFAFGAPAFLFGGPPNALIASNQFLPNPNLKPEKANSFEAGFRFRDEGLALEDDEVKFQIVGYWSDVEDFVETQVLLYNPSIPAIPLPPSPSPFNSLVFGSTQSVNANAELWGLEASAEYDAGPAFIRTTGQWLRGMNTDTDGPLGGIPASQIFVNPGVQFDDYGIEAGITALFSDDVTDVPSGTIDGDGYAVWGLYAQWQPHMLRDTAVSGAGVIFGIDNIFDKRYRIYPNEVREPGRNFKVTLNVPL